jgi:surfactin synthase thioesterase subunit
VGYESLLAWQRVSSADFCLHMINGGHFAVMEQMGWVLQELDVTRIDSPCYQRPGNITQSVSLS